AGGDATMSSGGISHAVAARVCQFARPYARSIEDQKDESHGGFAIACQSTRPRALSSIWATNLHCSSVSAPQRAVHSRCSLSMASRICPTTVASIRYSLAALAASLVQRKPVAKRAAQLARLPSRRHWVYQTASSG